MTQFSVDYAGLVRGLRMPLAPADLGAALLDAVAERYEHQFPDCSLLQFVQSGATYLFDLASAVGAEQEDRTLAAWTITPATVSKRDVFLPARIPVVARSRWHVGGPRTSHPPSFPEASSARTSSGSART